MKFIEVTTYAPQQFNILDDDDKLIAFIYVRCGKLKVYPYKENDIDWNTIIFEINFGNEYIGAIPDGLKDDIFETIINKLNNIKND